MPKVEKQAGVPAAWKKRFGWTMFVGSAEGFSTIRDVPDRKEELAVSVANFLEAGRGEPFVPSREVLEELDSREEELRNGDVPQQADA